MPPGNPPLLDPPPVICVNLVQVLSDSIHNSRDTHATNDASTDIEMTSASDPRRLLETSPGQQNRTAASTKTDHEGDATCTRGPPRAARLNHPHEAGQLTRKDPVPEKSCALTAAKPKAPPPPPTKAEMIVARPGLTIIHARAGTTPLKEVGAEIVVRKTNEVLDKLNATVQGEKVLVKAVRFLPSGDVSFYSENCRHKEWLNHNKHEWSKQVHPDLEASPSTYSVLAHGIPQTFNVDVATSKITIASDNNFISDKILKLRWLGGSRDPTDPCCGTPMVLAGGSWLRGRC
ncbi:hypothetical protein PGT21_037330 [Puccinia graminis f. sp. tritici]|uniref:Uncharacterized protein n=1 Tax=Puccinia graminis f. sp. tritici TaxID=56615 RepID=A0A5B0R4F3_PUCGR|nr:hypothetical protein PGT21_037330 [Puccinia graminis f. sp. tritici]